MGEGKGEGERKLMSGKQTVIARKLRKNLTQAERKLWYYLRRKQLDGLKFRRQEPIGRYIVDFCCYDKKLIIEVDGGQHNEFREKDVERDNCLANKDFNVLRFWNNDVLKNINGVLQVIKENCK